jgi:hypothetical protein
MNARGFDSVQALELALRMIGATLYASDHHKSGNLMWMTPGPAMVSRLQATFATC